jgi:hypothetical protein
MLRLLRFDKSFIEIQIFKRATPLKLNQGYWLVTKIFFIKFLNIQLRCGDRYRIIYRQNNVLHY